MPVVLRVKGFKFYLFSNENFENKDIFLSKIK